jgi:hypothetical protein
MLVIGPPARSAPSLAATPSSGGATASSIVLIFGGTVGRSKSIFAAVVRGAAFVATGARCSGGAGAAKTLRDETPGSICV